MAAPPYWPSILFHHRIRVWIPHLTCWTSACNWEKNSSLSRCPAVTMRPASGNWTTRIPSTRVNQWKLGPRDHWSLLNQLWFQGLPEAGEGEGRCAGERGETWVLAIKSAKSRTKWGDRLIETARQMETETETQTKPRFKYLSIYIYICINVYIDREI